MAFDFTTAFQNALQAGVAAAKPGGKAVEDWIKESAKANEHTLLAIAEGVKSKDISKETAEILLGEAARALDSEAAALAVTLKAAAQAAVNAFLGSLFTALKSALKLAL
ncbi:hypothetical protein [Polaromonas sp. YR568]|uniref:hypothetical protein n=1 Tax=Polaromonas sp. YR568 TaxID=1855301 RepID=UPI00398BDAB7